MKTKWHIAYGIVIFALLCSLLISNRQLNEQKAATQRKLHGIDDLYRSDIRSAGARLAECQSRINHATYLSKGMEMRDPEPIMGYPVCQLGCILTSIETDGIAICPEKELIAGYNEKLETMKANQRQANE